MDLQDATFGGRQQVEAELKKQYEVIMGLRLHDMKVYGKDEFLDMIKFQLEKLGGVTGLSSDDLYDQVLFEDGIAFKGKLEPPISGIQWRFTLLMFMKIVMEEEFTLPSDEEDETDDDESSTYVFLINCFCRVT